MICEVRALSPSDIENWDNEPARDPNDSVSLEKAWHGLHYLLTGSVGNGEGDLGFLLAGGANLGADRGYGPARVFSPPIVQRLNAALVAVSDHDLWGRFDPQLMEAQGIYPVIWDEDEAELKAEYLEYFHDLKTLVAKASAEGKAISVVIS